MKEEVRKVFDENPVLASVDLSEIDKELKRHGIALSDKELRELDKELDYEYYLDLWR